MRIDEHGLRDRDDLHVRRIASGTRGRLADAPEDVRARGRDASQVGHRCERGRQAADQHSVI